MVKLCDLEERKRYRRARRSSLLIYGSDKMKTGGEGEGCVWAKYINKPVSANVPPSLMTWTQEERDNPTLLYKMFLSKVSRHYKVFLALRDYKSTKDMELQSGCHQLIHASIEIIYISIY
ncbi:hypothetical protein YC2023_076143 [Brassica napus]